MDTPTDADYRGLLQLSPDGVIVVQADGCILAVNPNLEALFGYGAAVLQGLPLAFLLPAAAPALLQVLAEHAASTAGAPFQSALQEYWVQDSAGRTLAVDVRLAAVRAAQRPQPLVCISVRDATRRKQVEQALEEARLRSERFQHDLLNLSNTLPLALFQWETADDGIAKCSFVSERMLDVLGLPARAVLGHPGLLLKPLLPQYSQLLLEHVAQAQARLQRGEAGSGFSLELRALVRGGLRWLRMSALYGGTREDGRNIWNGYLEDITRRKQDEEDKELATLQFRTLWEKSPESYVFLDSQGLLSCNAAALDLFGVAVSEELLGADISQPRFSPPLQSGEQASPPLFAQLLAYASALARAEEARLPTPPVAGLRQLRGSLGFEWHLLRQGQGRFVADMVLTPMQIDAREGYLLICQDVSLQRQAQKDLLLAKQAAEDMARTKADFLANMSHEIRTPMNAIVGLSHLVLQGDLQDRQRDFLKKIQDSGQHLLGIINGILDFSKMEAGKLRLEESDFTLHSVLDQLANLVGERASAKGLTLVFEVDPLVPDALRGDALRLGQILINYTHNAIKFTSQGEICVAVRLLAHQGQQVRLRFEVRDTGIGLSREQMQRLFQSFQQADTSTTRQYGGTGLGLAISKNLAELMHGEVGVHSVPGQGSTFWFSAQLQQARHPGAGPREAALAQHGGTAQRLAERAGARILVVEDNDLNQLVARALLEGVGMQVDLADNGRTAVERVLHDPARWDQVMMDMQMPVLDGVSATREIRQALGQDRPVVIAMTANAMPQHRALCLQSGMQDFVSKPIDPKHLWETLLQWLPVRPQAQALNGASGAMAERPAGRPSASPAAETGAHAAHGAQMLPRAMPGFDPAQGLRRVLGKPASYLQLLRKFVVGQGDAVARLRAALVAGDAALALRIAHTLKGVAGNIGATQLQSDAGQLEAALGPVPVAPAAPAPGTNATSVPPAWEPALHATERSLGLLLQALRQQLPPMPPPQASRCSALQLDPVVAQLRLLLQHDDAAAVDVFDAHAALLQQAYPGSFRALQTALGDYDFPAALQYL